jgi:hypothetical protein
VKKALSVILLGTCYSAFAGTYPAILTYTAINNQYNPPITSSSSDEATAAYNVAERACSIQAASWPHNLPPISCTPFPGAPGSGEMICSDGNCGTGTPTAQAHIMVTNYANAATWSGLTEYVTSAYTCHAGDGVPFNSGGTWYCNH